ELKKVEDSISLHNTGEDEVINTIIKELNLYNRSVISKIIDIMNVFVIKNSNEGLFDFNKQPKPSFNKLIDLMKMDNYGFSKSDCKFFEITDMNGDINYTEAQMNEAQDFASDELEEGNSLSYIPQSEREVDIGLVHLSIFELHRRYQRGDIILKPFYQRGSVWNVPKKSKLIESVLRKIPIPSLYFAETDDGKWEVVDGQQRLTSFFEFLDNNFKLNQ